ncbi:unnamed protein product [Ranitomeya imitator]|uniref:Tetraspanin n=1 Tax=Ranitomeya imitator TaxID=111125 RepID=A0ABN9KTP0_9NEOB|nr:unnamed protein product [Ranitomeya imitator]
MPSQDPNYVPYLVRKGVQEATIRKKGRLQRQLSGSHTRVFSDNTTAVAYLNHQGGTRSDKLREVASDIMELAEGHLLSLSAVHIRGTDNFRADFLSRHTLHQREWMLSRKIFKAITARWGVPQIDLFATRANSQVKMFASLNREDKPDILDALQTPWTFDLAYAFPPWNLLPIGKTKGAGVTKNTLSRWIREAIILAYKAGGKDPPMHICGCALIGLGIYVLVQMHNPQVFKNASVFGPPIVIIAVGVVIFFISFFGCCGAVKENYCMVTTFAVLLGLIFLVEIAAAIAGYVYRGQFKCCGANNFTDWKNYDPFKGTNDVPDSCCKQFLLNCGKNLTNIYTAGCVPTIEAIFKTNIGIIAGVALGIAFFEVLGIIFACCLMKGIRSGYEVM